jgi:hypothetical protein
MQSDLMAIKKWLKKEGNSEAKLAYALGYTSSTAITMWFKRNNIPNYMKERVKELIK